MRTRSLARAAVLAVLLGVCATALVEGQKPAAPVTIPGLPLDKPCCLAQFHQATKTGEIVFALADPHDCKFLVPKPQKTAQDKSAVIHLPRLEAGKCDQTKALFKKGPLELTAKGGLIYREDGLAHFAGTFALSGPAGVAFKGRMEATFRVGTHTDPIGSEECNPKNHLEGWLVGSGPPATTLRALLAARYQGEVPPQGQVKLTVTGAVLNGVITECH